MAKFNAATGTPVGLLGFASVNYLEIPQLVLWFNSRYGGGMGLHFVAGAMPQLRRFQVDIDARGTLSKYDDFDIGIQHLPCLVHVHATIDWMSTTLTPSEVDAVEDEIRNKVSLYPNNPVLPERCSALFGRQRRSW
jgi:hypothetical protein